MTVTKDLAAGLFFIVLGAAGLFIGADYAFGTSARMGPGFVPKFLCWALVGLGSVIALLGVAGRGEAMDGWAMGPLLVISAAVLVFGAYLEPFGLEGATIGAVLVAGSGRAQQSRLQLTLVVLAMLLLTTVLLPGMTRKVGPEITTGLLTAAGVLLAAHLVLYAVKEDLREMIEQAVLALALSVISVIIFVDALGLTFKSIFALDLWLPVKKALVLPVVGAVRGLFRAITGI